MASTKLGDIPGARFHAPHVATHASVASNGAVARLGPIGPFAHDIRVRSAWWTPTGADNSITATNVSASYRVLSLVNGGTTGTGTTVVASLVNTATAASLAPIAMTVVTTATVASGAILYFSQATVGGALADGTTLAAGAFSVAFEVI
ncbi:MAG: hypothetical protein VW405_00885 [Rhodospirillaceae bacterium]